MGGRATLIDGDFESIGTAEQGKDNTWFRIAIRAAQFRHRTASGANLDRSARISQVRPGNVCDQIAKTIDRYDLSACQIALVHQWLDLQAGGVGDGRTHLSWFDPLSQMSGYGSEDIPTYGT